MTETADVLVVGFGAAGACAAIEAADAGARVLVLDRFGGGGATAISGGVVYAGGGTRQQRAAGVRDTPGEMADYLREEVGDTVAAGTLRRFCEQSAGMLDWLAGLGVPFDARLCPYKTSYPTNRHYLYLSGSETAFGQSAARGHRVLARGTSGRLLHRRLAAAVRDRGVVVRTQTRAERLVTDADGRVTGVECRTLTGWARLGHRVLHRWSVKPGLYLPGLGRALHRPVAWLERRHGRPLRISAGSVILCAGGFVFDREMMREHAPDYRGGLRLGTRGDDGSGIRLGVAAGGATAHLDRVSVWRFLSPPSAMLDGLLVDRDGRRVGDPARYGAAVGEAILRSPGGQAWLLLDAATLARCRRQVWSQTLWFQRWQALWLLTFGHVTGRTLAAVARRAGVDPAGLIATAGPATGPPPYVLIDVSVRNRTAFPAPMLTLGGLRVDEETGQVLGVPGLYAAGRTAVGICSRSYVSGLSLADCVFAGRRAGRSAAAVPDRGGRHADRR
ncbi:3-oxo-5alpha-steroid 4-dehydrogenase [Actinoplanes octamycinicus]|uniref:3-oxo-5alpha-steroid 4-dehydrogenase n=1 Tax=Actinoplanes octamycinicus TaxID=135948 RepID=A0A7W7H741_9ACTN|nr:FAD-binding protein [Actinoplanes octamycinicus]MBB4745240.1 3-oxo-5alpha-steroid 4-dehydrogenase [Actinoplanes octamycinicus]GIE62282.1 23S rRNA methyltransferase [Actinoplanes octamycinicus]